MKLLLLMFFGVAIAQDLTSQIAVSNGNKKFTTNLYKVLAQQKPNEDIFFSPMSVHAVLSMLYQGAGDSTKEALTATLQVEDPATAADGYSKIMSDLNGVENVTLHIANKIYVKKDYSLLPDYKQLVVNNFQSEVENIDFTNAPEAAGNINSWVKDKTRGKIEKLVEESDFNDKTHLVLLNAIYFKGGWRNAFDKDDTRTEPFYVDQNTQMEVQMMHRRGDYKYKNDFELNAQVIELPFKSEKVSMFIVLPFEKYGIDHLETNIQEHGLDKVFTDLSTSDVILAVPKFKLEKEIKLDHPLQELGLEILFDREKCNLLNLATADGNLYVSSAIQKAYVEFNEEGATAAAVTDIHGSPYRLLKMPVYSQFYANHPFLVILKDGDNILFYGKIMKPVSGDPDVAPRAEPNYDKDIELNLRYQRKYR